MSDKSHFHNAILTKGIPKTGQSTSYNSGDDGEYEFGWIYGLLLANNKTRFMELTLGGDNVIIDFATGLMWPKDWQGNANDSGAKKNWSDALWWSPDFAGFTDWVLPNIYQLLSLAHFETADPNPKIYDVFDNVQTDDYYWSSTTSKTTTTKAFEISYKIGIEIQIPNDLKILERYFVPCRVFKIPT